MTKFQVERTSGGHVEDAELLEDLRRIAKERGSDTVGMNDYRVSGTYSDTTVSRRFGSWNEALKAAGLTIRNEVDLSDERLFENILQLWTHYGRQPRRSELARAPSTISQSPYSRRFGSWRAALVAFVDAARASDIDGVAKAQASRKASPRDPSQRLRFRVLQRDRFTCCACGASPAKAATVELHVDHIVPWSAGGETSMENLRTLCSVCNLGKGALNGG